jgi:spore germination protein PA
MPAVVGTVNVNSLSGVMNFGDVHTIAPRGLFQTYAGSGSFNSANKLNINNGASTINICGAKAFEQSSPVPELQVGGEQ